MDVLEIIKVILTGGWQILVKTDVPGLGFSFAMLFVTLALVPIGFSFLSLVLEFNVGHMTDSYGTRSSKKAKISDARKNDTW